MPAKKCQPEDKVVVSTAIVVDVDPNERGNSPRFEAIVRQLTNAIEDAFRSESAVEPSGSVAFDWLNQPDTNFGRCSDCKRLVSDIEKPNQFEV